MEDSALIPNTVLVGERDYAAAINLIIQQAHTNLVIFDQDLTHGDYASVARYDSLHHFISQDTHSSLTMILHSADYLTQHCPRLFALFTTYSHKMQVYITNDFAKVAKDCFIIADDVHYIRRFHVEQARFKFALDDPDTCASLSTRFEELLQETAGALSIVQLGL
ncbi:MAG TPA: hypothetical protein VGD04_01055 [Methylophilus sp.]